MRSDHTVSKPMFSERNVHTIELNDLILGHAKRGVLAHYDHSKRIQERALWLRRWADFVAECVGLRAAAKPADGLLHVYVTPAGLPEMRATKEPARGRRYLGAFTPIEAAREVEAVARDLGKRMRDPGRVLLPDA